MMMTIVMTWDRQELPIDIGIEKRKIENRISEKNQISDSYGAMYDSLALTADTDNEEPILVSDYDEEHQENTEAKTDFIAINPAGELLLPWNREITALNRPFVMWQAGDVLKVVAR